MIAFDFPVPPSINHYYRSVRGRVIISKRGRVYRETVCALVAEKGFAKTLEGKVAIKIDFFPPDRRRRDADNVLKALLDSLQAAQLFYDDSQIHDLSIRKQDMEKGGRVFVQIWEIGKNGKRKKV